MVVVHIPHPRHPPATIQHPTSHSHYHGQQLSITMIYVAACCEREHLSDPTDRCAFAYISESIYLSAVAATKLIKRRLLSSIIAHLPSPVPIPCPHPFATTPSTRTGAYKFFHLNFISVYCLIVAAFDELFVWICRDICPVSQKRQTFFLPGGMSL